MIDKKRVKFQEYPIRTGKCEIIAATGKIRNIPRKVVVFAVYIPPKYTAKQNREALDYLNDAVLKAKTSGAAAYQLGNTSSRTITEVKQR